MGIERSTFVIDAEGNLAAIKRRVSRTRTPSGRWARSRS